MWKSIVAIALGAAIGGLLRWMLSQHCCLLNHSLLNHVHGSVVTSLFFG